MNSEAGQHGPSRRKTNQDNYLMFSNQDDEDFVAAVMDGHGEQGEFGVGGKGCATRKW